MKYGSDLRTWRYDATAVCFFVVAGITFFLLLFMSLLLFAADTVDGQQSTLDVVAVVPADFPPHYSLDEEGNTKGFAIDVFNEVARIAKLNVKYIVKETWKEVDKTLRDGQADLIPNLGITAGRQRRFSFSRPMETYPVSIFVRKETNYILGVDDLSELDVAIVQYNVAGNILTGKPGIKLKTFITAQEALFDLLSGNVDAFVYPAPGVRRLAKSVGMMYRLKVVGDPLVEIKRGIAVHKDNTVLLSRVDAALSTFLGSESYKKLYVQWHGGQPAFWTVERVLVSMGALVLLSMVVMFVWRYVSLAKINHRLRTTVKAHKETKYTLSKSEGQVRLLLDFTAEAIYGIDIEGHCTFANPACVRILGYNSINDLLGKDMHKLIHHSYEDGSEYPVEDCHIYQAFRENRGTHHDDELLWRSDGSSFYAEYWSYPVIEEGETVGAVVTFNDITERKLSMAALEQSRANLKAITENAGEGILVNAGGKHVFANQYMLDMTGYSEKEIYETGIKDLIHADQYEFVLSQFKRRMAGENVQNRYETVFVNKQGKNIPVELTAAKTLWQGQPAGLAIVHDISKRKLEEAELAQHREHLQELVEERTHELKNARDEALEAVSAKSVFLAKMSHELRTPLNSIIGFSGLVRDGIAGPVNEEQKKQLGMVFDSAQHLLQLINEVLDLSKIEAGKAVASKSQFLLEPMLAEIQDMLYLQADRKGLSLDVVASKAPQVLFTDQNKIKQVLVNLLGNAVKFTERGAVTLSCWQQKKAVCFSVKDTGMGIDKGQLEDVFNAFHQEDRGDARQHQGTGLGLTICKEFVALLGGEIGAQSKSGQGSVFTVRLPNAVVESENRTQRV